MTMDIVSIKNFIQKNKVRHLSNKVLHTHPSPKMWKTDLKEEENNYFLLNTDAQYKSINLYLGIPYCIPTDPPHCGFCLFPTQDYKGKREMDFYLDFLSREAHLYKEFYQGAKLESLYVGGGTPNLLQPNDYMKLTKVVSSLFPDAGISSPIEMTLEGIPQLFNEDKIRAIKDAGFNRVSMGVQQVNDELIATSGRKQTRKQVFDAIELFHKYSLSCNVDLIYGWPNQTVEVMLRDLESIVQSGIKHITHYELNIAGRSDFATKQKQNTPSIEKKIEMYNIAKQFLISKGYKQKTVYDWEKEDNNQLISEKYLYEDNLRDCLDANGQSKMTTMSGLGYAAVNMRLQPNSSSIKSVSAMNHRNLTEYYNAISLNKLPVERMFVHDTEDVKLIWIFQALQEMKINTKKYEKIFNSNIKLDYKPIWDALAEEGWVEHNDEYIKLINEGEFYTPLIQALLSQPRIKSLQQ